MEDVTGYVGSSFFPLLIVVRFELKLVDSPLLSKVASFIEEVAAEPFEMKDLDEKEWEGEGKRDSVTVSAVEKAEFSFSDLSVDEANSVVCVDITTLSGFGVETKGEFCCAIVGLDWYDSENKGSRLELAVVWLILFNGISELTADWQKMDTAISKIILKKAIS